MENLILYGISKEEIQLGDLAVQFIEHDGVYLFFDEVEKRSTDKTMLKNEVLAYYNVVEELHQQATLIAFRFNTRVQNSKALVSFVEKYSYKMNKALDYVSGHSEYSLRLKTKKMPTEGQKNSEPNSGTDYMLQLQKKNRYDKKEYARVEKLSREAQIEIEPIAKAVKIENSLAEQQTLTLQFLVHNKDIIVYKKMLESFKSRLSDVDYVASGPWPIFSFGNFIEL